jgi:hypothetical protein
MQVGKIWLCIGQILLLLPHSLFLVLVLGIGIVMKAVAAKELLSETTKPASACCYHRPGWHGGAVVLWLISAPETEERAESHCGGKG